MSNQPLLSQLMAALRCLPGVGAKSAQRMSYYLLERNREGGRHLAKVLAWIARVRPRRAVLTHMNRDLDYNAVQDLLPEGVEPAYDGQVIEA